MGRAFWTGVRLPSSPPECLKPNTERCRLFYCPEDVADAIKKLFFIPAFRGRGCFAVILAGRNLGLCCKIRNTGLKNTDGERIS